MLSYQHAYHAGGPADVHKHAVLNALALHMGEKDKPFCALDVFAGEGVYDLAHAMATKTNEYTQGIGALWSGKISVPAALAAYLTLVRSFNPDGVLKTYPGSPAVVKAHLRDIDRLIVNELHPAANEALHHWARRDSRIAVHKRDALEALGALVPPPIRRGFAVIDPSYEVAAEYAATGAAVVRAIAKWTTGIYVVWYPLLADARHAPLLSALKNDIDFPTVVSEITFDTAGLPDAPKMGLRGSGLVIVNPPWQFETVLMDIGEWLAAALPFGPKAQHTLTWLTPRRA